jgi:hypothetical protein
MRGRILGGDRRCLGWGILGTDVNWIGWEKKEDVRGRWCFLCLMVWKSVKERIRTTSPRRIFAGREVHHDLVSFCRRKLA